MYTHDTSVRVRYAETDQMGYVYYGAYAAYYEVGRVEALRTLGISYKTIEEEESIIMPVISLESRFIRPSFYDDILLIRTSIPRLPKDTISFNVEIFNSNMQIVNQAKVNLCFIDKTNGQRIQAPELILKKLATYFEEK